jgi:hypothetical protein
VPEDEPAQNALGQLDVLGQQRQECLGLDRQADRDVDGPDCLAHRVPFEDLLEGQRRRCLERDGGAGLVDGGDLPVEHQLQRRRRRAALVDDASRLVADLLAQRNDAEQLVHRREVEDRQSPEPIDEQDGRQRLLPELAATVGGHARGGQRPRRGLEHLPVADVAVLQGVLEIAGQRPQLALSVRAGRRGRGRRFRRGWRAGSGR